MNNWNISTPPKRLERTYADKLKANNTISCKCDQIKPQLLVAQNELSSVKTITDIIREELKCMKQTTYMNLFPAINCPSVKSSKTMASSIPNPTHSKPRTSNYSQYSIPTSNRFDILSNYKDLQLNEPGCSSDLDWSILLWD